MAKKSKDEIEARKRCFLRYVFRCKDEGKTSEDFAWEAWSAMAVGRKSRFYKSEEGRCELRRFGWQKAEAIANTVAKGAAGVRAEVLDGKFTKRIQKFQEAVESAHGDKLENGMKFGRAQKFVNLYLKFMWCAGEIPVAPPHCPFDDIMIRQLISQNAFDEWHGIKCLKRQEGHADIRHWTKSNNSGDYRIWLAAAREVIKGEYRSLSEWELVVFGEEICKRKGVRCLCQIHGFRKRRDCCRDN